MKVDNKPRFAEILEYHLNIKLQNFSKKNFDRNVMEEMYGMIRETVHDIFSKSSMNPTDATKDWISQQYYESIKFSSNSIITGDPETWDHTVFKVYTPIRMSDIPADDLRFIAGLFNEMTFFDKIVEEIRKR